MTQQKCQLTHFFGLKILTCAAMMQHTYKVSPSLCLRTSFNTKMYPVLNEIYLEKNLRARSHTYRAYHLAKLIMIVTCGLSCVSIFLADKSIIKATITSIKIYWFFNKKFNKYRNKL